MICSIVTSRYASVLLVVVFLHWTNSTWTDHGEILFNSQVHGPKVNILENGTVARRYEGYCYAVCFTDRPLKVGQTLHFNITQIEPGWMANMNIGIIYSSPDAISPSDLVNCVGNISTEISNTEVFIFERFYSDDNMYEFRIDANGTAYLSPNVTYNDVVFTGVNVKKPFWVIFNVFGDTKAIKLEGTTDYIDQYEQTPAYILG